MRLLSRPYHWHVEPSDVAFSEFEQKRFERILRSFVERRRPPPYIRSELDVGFRLTGQSAEIFEIRPRWDQPSVIVEHPVAKATYVKTRAVWRVFWQRADLKWHSYRPAAETPSLEHFVEVVDDDAFGCFWG